MHLLSNVAAFVPPRYATLPPAPLATLLHLSAAVMSTLPPGALDPNSSAAAGKQVADSESDSDSEGLTHTSALPSTLAPLPRLDERTSRRLQTLPAPTHINSLIRATQNHTAARIALCDFLFALCSVWSLGIDSILSTITVSTGGGFVRELYRLYVRGSPLGKEVGLASLLGTSHAFYCIIFSLLNPGRPCECGRLAPSSFSDRPVHPFASYHGRRRVLFRPRCASPCQRPTQPTHSR